MMAKASYPQAKRVTQLLLPQFSPIKMVESTLNWTIHFSALICFGTKINYYYISVSSYFFLSHLRRQSLSHLFGVFLCPSSYFCVYANMVPEAMSVGPALYMIFWALQ